MKPCLDLCHSHSCTARCRLHGCVCSLALLHHCHLTSNHAVLCGVQAIHKINPSVAQKDVKRHEEWLKVYGSI